MDRYNFEEHISAYIDGELSPEDKIKFEELMESESDCKGKYNQINSLVKNIRSMPKLETDDNFIEELNKKIDNHYKSKASIFKIFEKYIQEDRKPILGFAMSFAAIFMVFYLYLDTSDDSSSMASSPQDSTNETYYSDIDSTDSDEYDDEIQLTKGTDESE